MYWEGLYLTKKAYCFWYAELASWNEPTRIHCREDETSIVI